MLGSQLEPVRMSGRFSCDARESQPGSWVEPALLPAKSSSNLNSDKIVGLPVVR